MGWVTTVLVSASCVLSPMFSVSTALRPCSRTTRANSSDGSDRCCGAVPCPYSTAGILPARRGRRGGRRARAGGRGGPSLTDLCAWLVFLLVCSFLAVVFLLVRLARFTRDE